MNFIHTFVLLIVFFNSSEARSPRNEQTATTPKVTAETFTKSTTVTTSTASPLPSSSSPSSLPTPIKSISSSSSSPTLTTPSTPTKAFNSSLDSVKKVISSVSNNTRLQVITSSSSAFANNVVTALSNSLSSLTNQLTKRFNLNFNATELLNNLWSSISRSDLVQSRTVLSVAGVTLFGFVSLVALYLFPSLRSNTLPLLNDRNQLKKIGEIGRSIEQMAFTINEALDSYSKTEPDTCMMIALCTLGKAKEVSRKSRAIETINTVLNFPGLDKYLISNKAWLDSHAYGREGNDCDTININQQCPLNYQTWKLLLSSLSSYI